MKDVGDLFNVSFFLCLTLTFQKYYIFGDVKRCSRRKNCYYLQNNWKGTNFIFSKISNIYQYLFMLTSTALNPTNIISIGAYLKKRTNPCWQQVKSHN